MAAILGRFFHWPTSDRITVDANAVRGEVYRHLRERRAPRAPSATGGLAQRPRETLVVERDEVSPYRGLAVILAMSVGVSFWASIIWAVMRAIR